MHEGIIVRADVADSDYVTNSLFAKIMITYEHLLDDLITRISHCEIPQGNALLRETSLPPTMKTLLPRQSCPS